MTIPKTQRAIVSHEYGGPEVLKYDEVPVPDIADNEVLVKNDYAGVNFIEVYTRTGLYKVEHPFRHGREATGVVVKAGSKVTKFKEGDHVAYIKSGALSEYINIGEQENIIKFQGDDKTTSAAILQGLTAYVLTTRTYKVKKGDTVLVHAAAGGTGAIVVQLAKHFGATVIGSTSSEEKAKIARDAGADHVINYKKEDIAEKVKEYTNGVGVQAVFDSVGKSTWQASIDSAAKLGHVVSFGNASGAVAPFTMLDLSPKSLTVTRPSLYNYIGTKEEWESVTGEFLKLLHDGVVKVNIYKVYPLKDFAEALSELESGKTTGKLLIKIPE